MALKKLGKLRSNLGIDLLIFRIGTIEVTQPSVHTAIQKVDYQATSILIDLLSRRNTIRRSFKLILDLEDLCLRKNFCDMECNIPSYKLRRKFHEKILPFAIMMSLAIPIFAPTDFQSTVSAKSKIESKIKSQLQSNIPNGVEKKLDLGIVTVYDFGDVKLHSYNTNDPLADEFYLFESNQGLVLLESGAMKSNVAEFNEYIKSLKKPLS